MDKVPKITGLRPNRKEQKKNKRSDFNDNAVVVLCKPRPEGDQAPRDGKMAMGNVLKIHLGYTYYLV